MSGAPERIWAGCQIEYEGNRNNYHRSWDDDGPCELFHEEWYIAPTEYVRADLHAAAIARAERAEAALALLHSRASDLLFCYRHGNGLDGWHKAADGLDDAINKIEATKGGAA